MEAPMLALKERIVDWFLALPWWAPLAFAAGGFVAGAVVV